jgi:hypothetical protein
MISFYGICLNQRKEMFEKLVRPVIKNIEIIKCISSLEDERIAHLELIKDVPWNINNFCTLSHYVAMQAISNSSCEYGVVFEDDVCLHKNFLSLLDALILSRQIKDIVSIGYLFEKEASPNYLHSSKTSNFR